MPLITERKDVLDIYAEAAEKKWVLPCFCTENLTTTEAILSAVKEYGENISQLDLPIIIAITNQYDHRSQSAYYTHTRKWNVGLDLFMADLKVLTSVNSPFSNLKVMVHLDHIQPETDKELLSRDLSGFSSIMYDASSLPLEDNIKTTKKFVASKGAEIVVEGACDEIVDAEGAKKSDLTTPGNAQKYFKETGVDFMVANLGTEHRANAMDLKYRADLARNIKDKIGPKLVLHGCSSVSSGQITDIFNDGVCKVNIWTTLERDSTPVLFREMINNASSLIGPDNARKLKDEKLLGDNCSISNKLSLDYFTTSYRQNIIFNHMKEIATSYLKLWYK